jgi:CDGSH-type Zn-finger protein/uncharacterized Fe-S cluster protein YjdI
MTVEIAEGTVAVVRFDAARCIHARRCVMGAPGAFRANVDGPWIDPDAADPEALMRVAYACPSGAITVERRDGGLQEGPPAANVAMLRENGPIAVHADLTIVGHGRTTRATLCRCGLSKNKPFCDNSHVEGGFVASGEPPSRPSTLSIPELVGPVEVRPQPNGPLMVVGRIEIESGTGRNVARVERAFLCRCGQSANKPFCDNTHKSVGFEAP